MLPSSAVFLAGRPPSNCGDSMTAAQISPLPPDAVLVLGRIPPPVTGMTLLTQEVLEHLQALGTVDFINWSVGASHRTPFTRFRYILRSFNSLRRLLVRGRRPGQRLYLVANSDAGLYLTAMLAFAAGRMGYAVHLHHHVYNYIDRYDRRMAWIDRNMGRRGVHIVACKRMMRDFENQYGTKRPFMVIRPSAVPIALGTPRTTRADPLRLGMLSNLSLAKGLDQVIETFVALHRAGRRVTLVLAGPALDRRASQLVDETVTAYPGLVTYLGPIYGDAKARFFADIDVFLFATQRESWGIVLHEAMAAGVPVISNDRGCTGMVVGERAGLIVQSGASFVDSASRQIERWLAEPAEYLAASQAAVEQADFLNREGQRTLSEFAAHMFSPPAAAIEVRQPT
jgi:glycosyltransferase involved in cell wall biosynthesis